MSQNPPRGWEPPSSGEPEPPPPGYGAAPPPQYGYGQPPQPQPGYGAGYPPGPQPGYQQGYGQVPPPYAGHQPGYPAAYGLPAWAKPGVVPLRPLTLGEILDGAVQTIRLNPKVMLGLSAVVNLALAVVVVLAQLAAVSSLVAGADDGSSSDSVTAGAAQLVTSLGAALLQAVGTTVLTGLLVIAVSDAVLGRRRSVREVWDRARGRLWALLGVTALIFLTLAGLAAACVVPGVLLLVAGSDLAGGLVLSAGIVALICLGPWIAIRWLFAPPSVLLERTGVLASMGRSWRLVKGSWWRCFGILLLAQVLAAFLSGVLQTPFLIVGVLAGGSGSSVLFILVTSLGGLIARTLIAPFSAAILVLLYIDLRMRREGLDVTLQRAAAQQAAPGGP